MNSTTPQSSILINNRQENNPVGTATGRTTTTPVDRLAEKYLTIKADKAKHRNDSWQYYP